jgi:hypothetical protein
MRMDGWMRFTISVRRTINVRCRHVVSYRFRSFFHSFLRCLYTHTHTHTHDTETYRDGYGGAFVYTREAKLPESLLPRLRLAAQKVNMNFDKDFVITDNSCPPEVSSNDKVLLREQYAGKVALLTTEQVQAEATRVRTTAVTAVQDELGYAEQVVKLLEDKIVAFETQLAKDAVQLEEKALQLILEEEEIVKNAVGARTKR